MDQKHRLHESLPKLEYKNTEIREYTHLSQAPKSKKNAFPANPEICGKKRIFWR